MIAHTEECERNGNDDDDGPKVNKLRTENGRVPVGEDNEIVSLDVAKCKDYVYCKSVIGESNMS